MKKLLLLAMSSIIVSTGIFAGTSSGGCKYLHVQISNQTSSPCILTDETLNSGYLVTSPPTSILVNDSKRFDIDQTVFGPDIALTYQCGTGVIRFESQQGVCVVYAGAVKGNILEPTTANITATFTANEGSAYWDKSGSINWVITEKSST
jgi:hypothetical protein